MKKRMNLWLGVSLAVFLLGHVSVATPADTTVKKGPAEVSKAAKKKVPEKENVYEVLYPLGRSTIAVKPLAPRLDTLKGKTICELWNDKFFGNITFPIIEELLVKKYPDVKFVPYTKFGYTYGATEAKDVAALPKRLVEYGCNAVISGNGC
jgi:hypothetical protein